MKKSRIEIEVSIDENTIPEKIVWSAEDGKMKDEQAAALFLALWDKRSQNSMKMDLWTKDMTVDEMKVFFHQTLVSMADAFHRATGETDIVEDLKDYCFHFAEKMKLMK